MTFLGSLHWPVGGADLGVGGVSNVQLLILFELWAGERLALEKAHPRYLKARGAQFQCRLFPFRPGIDNLAFLSVCWCFYEVPLHLAWWFR